MGVSNRIIGYLFVFLTVGVYALIGILSRTAEMGEYYVAGRKVPAFYNGMATGSDWMSAASFIGMAGSLYLLGYDGQIGRASCRERVCQYGSTSVGAESLKK